MSKLEDFYNLLPESVLSSVMPTYGTVMSTLGNNDIGRRLIEMSHRTSGKICSRLLKLSGADESRDAVDISREFIEQFFGDITETEEEGMDEWVFSFDECPYGFCDEEHIDLCHAAMNLEEEMIEGLGGELVIEERIPEGADRCRFRVSNL